MNHSTLVKRFWGEGGDPSKSLRCGNLSFENHVLYSYAMPIAWHAPDGLFETPVAFIRSYQDAPSDTTRSHISAAYGRGTGGTVLDIPPGTVPKVDDHLLSMAFPPTHNRTDESSLRFAAAISYVGKGWAEQAAQQLEPALLLPEKGDISHHPLFDLATRYSPVSPVTNPALGTLDLLRDTAESIFDGRNTGGLDALRSLTEFQSHVWGLRWGNGYHHEYSLVNAELRKAKAAVTQIYLDRCELWADKNVKTCKAFFKRTKSLETANKLARIFGIHNLPKKPPAFITRAIARAALEGEDISNNTRHLLHYLDHYVRRQQRIEEEEAA